MTADFLHWYELNERRLDGTPKQAAWLAWNARGDSRAVAQARLESAGDDGFEAPRLETVIYCQCGARIGSGGLCPNCGDGGFEPDGIAGEVDELNLAAMAAGGVA